MRKTLKDLAKLVSGEILGDKNISISGVAPIESSKNGEITFVLKKNNLKPAESSKASALVAPVGTKPNKPSILVKNPRLALAKILEAFMEKPYFSNGIHKSVVSGKAVAIDKSASIGAYVVIEDNVKIGKGTIIYPGVFIGKGSAIGSNCTVYSNAVIYNNVKIGNRVIINAGAVIGVSGFGFAQDKEKHIKIPQIGGVIIEDDVELFANTCVSSGTMTPTIIHKGTKIDSLTHVAHNCSIGENCAITALIAFGGSSFLGNNVYVGGQSAFAEGTHVGDNSIVMAKSGITKDFGPNSVISGFPAQQHSREMEIKACLRKLPDFINKLSEIEKSIKG